MQQLQTIYYALQCGDAKTAVSTLKNCTAKILAENDLFAAKHSYRILGYVLVSLKLETSCPTDIPIPPFRGDDIHMLYEKDLPQCFYSIAAQIRQQHTEQTERLEQDILEYIQINLANQQLSIALVSDHFHISAPTLQKRMNAICGKTFSAYVESSRMEKARQLLRETNDTVQDIAESVGYINSNSFFKAFKRNFGETPLSYRNRNC
ncbi:MAG: helix-turn-helix transcriptional regulator [Lachnospiraceae bacterium]|nr:helix-turn-helix transcriptional regulator [Lachnospiraceae bacterium]